MGELTEMVLEGILCERCFAAVQPIEDVGHPRLCEDCRPKRRKRRKKRAPKT